MELIVIFLFRYSYVLILGYNAAGDQLLIETRVQHTGVRNIKENCTIFIITEKGTSAYK